MYKKGKNMKKIEIEQIPNILKASGISPLVKVEVGQTRAGKPRLTLSGKEKILDITDGSGLPRILDGDINFLLTAAANTIAISGGDMSSIQLLEMAGFRSACVTEIDIKKVTRPLCFTHKEDGKVPVVYGSTAGINIAEVLQTALCGNALQAKIDSKVYFDIDGRDSVESQAILVESLATLPVTLKEKVARFIQGNGRNLFTARIIAVTELTGIISGIPDVQFFNVMTPFRAIKDKFTLGQLMLMAKTAGSDPKLFDDKFGKEVKTRDLISRFSASEDPTDLLKASIFDQFADLSPAGFTFYAREARLGQLYTFAAPLKMTDKANIYKILLSMGSLYSPETGLGMILMPISRMRILSRESLLSTRPIDPVVLRIMSLEDPAGFQRLIQAFKREFKVLTPYEAISAGTKDIRFVATDYMDIGDKYEI